MISLQPVILIVDDSDEDRATLRRYLERAGPDGYRCHEASTAAEGLELCRVLHPDAILLDYSLPDDDGLEFLAALVAEHGPLACAVVMLTGAGNATVAVQALKLGAQDYLVKGHDIRQRVILALNGAIEKVQLQRQVEQQRLLLAHRQHLQSPRTFPPLIAKGFATVVAFKVEVLGEHFELALNRADVSRNAMVCQVIVQLAGCDLVAARDAAHQLQREAYCFLGV